MQRATLNFVKEIEQRVASAEPCWFPGLANMLVGEFWAEVGNLDPTNYSTETWLNRAQRRAVLQVPLQGKMVLERLPATFYPHFEEPAFDLAEPDVVRLFTRALASLAPAMVGETVASLVRSVHCIAAYGPGYDSSHSEPLVPFSVFVSVPLGERHAELRLGESLLHEAMHLQLTLIERHAPMVVGDAGTAYSPWQQCERPVQGLLHGLYVFAAIYQWLQYIAAEPTLQRDDRAYVERRSREIEEEVRSVQTLRHELGLSEVGRSLADWLLGPFCVTSAGLATPFVATDPPLLKWSAL